VEGGCGSIIESFEQIAVRPVDRVPVDPLHCLHGVSEPGRNSFDRHTVVDVPGRESVAETVQSEIVGDADFLRAMPEPFGDVVAYPCFTVTCAKQFSSWVLLEQFLGECGRFCRQEDHAFFSCLVSRLVLVNAQDEFAVWTARNKVPGF
jgi:hypothetical protein